ncbi:hypothetical protein NQ318_016873, partial [Aromia moschata]
VTGDYSSLFHNNNNNKLKRLWKLEKVETYALVISAEGVMTTRFAKNFAALGLSYNIIRNGQKAVVLQTGHIAFGTGNPAYPSYARRSRVGESNFVYGCGKPAYSGYAWGSKINCLLNGYESWMQAIGRDPKENLSITHNAICSDHFTQDSHIYVDDKRKWGLLYKKVVLI